MKRFFAIFIIAIMLLTLSACNQTQSNEQSSETSSQTPNISNNVVSDSSKSDTEDSSENIPNEEPSTEDTTSATDIPSANSIEELEAAIEKDVDDTITALDSEWEELQLNITTYEEYSENVEAVEEFYDKVYTTTEQLCIRIQEYTVQYAELIMSSDMSNDDKYDEFDEIYDCISVCITATYWHMDLHCCNIRNCIFDFCTDSVLMYQVYYCLNKETHLTEFSQQNQGDVMYHYGHITSP